MNAYKACVKCYKVIFSCKNYEQALVAHNMVFNFGKMFGFNFLWSGLDKQITHIEEAFVDKFIYDQRSKGAK